MTKARNSQITRTIPLLITIFSLSLPAYSKYSGGTGEPNDPYQIAMTEDLILLGDIPDDHGKHFRLTADIDLSAHIWPEAVIREFSGTFDGCHHSIEHLTSNRAGLFGKLTSKAQVRNLGLVNVSVVSSKDYVGGLVGDNDGGYISGCYCIGTVRGRSSIGGLVGNNWGTVMNCFSSGMVKGENHQIGGLIGKNYKSGIVSNCYSTAMVIGDWRLGGLLGYNERGKVITSYSTGMVISSGSSGGLVGEDFRGDIIACFWDTETSGQIASAGGTGKTTAEMQTASTFLDAGWDFVDESENGTHEFWQIGDATYPVLSIFSGFEPPQLKGEGTPDDPYLISTPEDLGAVIWYSPHRSYALTRNIDLSEIRWSQMVIPIFSGTFDGKGFIVSNLTINGVGYLGFFSRLTSIGQIRDFGLTDVSITGSKDYLGGLVAINEGTVSNCHSIGTIADGYGSIGGLVGHNLGTMIECHSAGFVDGCWSVGGLVGVNSASVISCSSDATVTGVWFVGGLLGASYDFVTESYSTGTVSGIDRVGGLVGLNDGDATRCYSTGTISGTDGTGGLMGANYYLVSDCYSNGEVNGSIDVGGLVGENEGTVACSYSAGAVSGNSHYGGLIGANSGAVYLSYWDIEASGLSTSRGGRSRTTLEMKTLQTFRGWGLDGAWILDEGRDYPHLAWENRPGTEIIDPPRTYGGGSGEPNSPYQIWTAEQLTAIGWYRADFEKHFVVMTDIDFGKIDLQQFVSIGTKLIPFTGIFEGAGHTIRNMTLPLAGDNFVALFGSVGISGEGTEAQTGVVQNIQLIDIQIAGDYYVAGLVACNTGIIADCTVSGTVNGVKGDSYIVDAHVGGLVGYNSGNVSNCRIAGTVSSLNHRTGGVAGYNSGTISETTNTSTVIAASDRGNSVGGVVGSNKHGSLINCSSTGAVTGQHFVGGVVGFNDLHGSLTNCYAIGSVTGNRAVGGLIGYSEDGDVICSYSIGKVRGTYNVGGLLGSNHWGHVSGCYNTGEVRGTDDVGGLVGHNSGGVMDCYSSGEVRGTDDVGGLVGYNYFGEINKSYSVGLVNGIGDHFGGLVGENHEGDVTACFWNIETSGQTVSDGGIGKTTAEMQTATTFLEAGWDFLDETVNGTDNIWWILEGQYYPRLWWEAAEQ